VRWRRFGATAVAVVVVSASLAGCGPDNCDADRPGVQNALAYAEAWLRVIHLPGGVPGGEGTLAIEMSVVPVGPGRSDGPVRMATIEVHDSFTGHIESGLEAGADVYLALTSMGSRKEQVGSVLVRAEDGVYSLGGKCGDGDMAFLRGELADADAALDRVVGLTEGDRIVRILMPSPPSNGP